MGKDKHPDHGHVDLGEGITIGVHAAAKLRALIRAIKAAAVDGVKPDEIPPIVDGPGHDLVHTLATDIAHALED